MILFERRRNEHWILKMTLTKILTREFFVISERNPNQQKVKYEEKTKFRSLAR